MATRLNPQSANCLRIIEFGYVFGKPVKMENSWLITQRSTVQICPPQPIYMRLSAIRTRKPFCFSIVFLSRSAASLDAKKLEFQFLAKGASGARRGELLTLPKNPSKVRTAAVSGTFARLTRCLTLRSQELRKCSQEECTFCRLSRPLSHRLSR